MRRSDQRRDAVFACYQRDVTGRPLAELIGEAKPFTVELAEGVEEHRDELDAAISRNAHGWELDRIAPLERNIMRVALIEMKPCAIHEEQRAEVIRTPADHEQKERDSSPTRSGHSALSLH